MKDMFTLTNIIYLTGAFDAVCLLGLGLVAAFYRILGWDKEDWFWDRALPSTGILVGTSFAAAVVMAVTRWLSGL